MTLCGFKMYDIFCIIIFYHNLIFDLILLATLYILVRQKRRERFSQKQTNRKKRKNTASVSISSVWKCVCSIQSNYYCYCKAILSVLDKSRLSCSHSTCLVCKRVTITVTGIIRKRQKKKCQLINTCLHNTTCEMVIHVEWTAE